MNEVKINALRFCLQCDCWRAIKIGGSGWWMPCECEYWNGEKSTEDKPYGPMVGCKYKLEHYLLDNRLGFKLVSGETFIPLIEFAEKHLDLKWCSDKKKEYQVILKSNKDGKDLYITKMEVIKNDLIIDDIVNWINKKLRREGYRKLTHKYRYDQIRKTRNGKWEYVQIEDDAEKN